MYIENGSGITSFLSQSTSNGLIKKINCVSFEGEIEKETETKSTLTVSKGDFKCENISENEAANFEDIFSRFLEIKGNKFLNIKHLSKQLFFKKKHLNLTIPLGNNMLNKLQSTFGIQLVMTKMKYLDFLVRKKLNLIMFIFKKVFIFLFLFFKG